MMSSFVVTLGSWDDLTQLLSDEVAEWLGWLCLLHKLTIGFAVIEVINGVFINTTFRAVDDDDNMRVRNHEKGEDRAKERMRNLFKLLDRNKDGFVEFREFRVLQELPEVKKWLASLDMFTDDLP